MKKKKGERQREANGNGEMYGSFTAQAKRVTHSESFPILSLMNNDRQHLAEPSPSEFRQEFKDIMTVGAAALIR